MKIAVISDIHNNMVRLEEALREIKRQKISICICCGDVGSLEILTKAAKGFNALYLSLGNLDYELKSCSGLFPDNVIYAENVLSLDLAGKKIAVIHFDYLAKKIAKEEKYDLVFYGHTHTPWEKKYGRTIILNPGEITGQFGKATFAVFDLETMKGKLFLVE